MSQSELASLKLNLSLSAHRDPSTRIRCVPPYLRTLTAVAKPRWAGAPLLDTLEAEFVSCKSRASNLLALKKGLILVNGEKTSPDYKLKFQDSVSRLVHFHEPPVLCPSPSLSIAKVSLPAGLGSVYCVSKPPTMPTHPAGQYLSNSMTVVAEAALGLPPGSLRPCHRLDKCTSGLVVCGADKGSVKAVLGRMEGGKVEKTYLARVMGWEAMKVEGLEGVEEGGGGSVVVDRPIKCLDPQEGVRAVHKVRSWAGSEERKTRRRSNITKRPLFRSPPPSLSRRRTGSTPRPRSPSFAGALGAKTCCCASPGRDADTKYASTSRIWDAPSSGTSCTEGRR